MYTFTTMSINISGSRYITPTNHDAVYPKTKQADSKHPAPIDFDVEIPVSYLNDLIVEIPASDSNDIVVEVPASDSNETYDVVVEVPASDSSDIVVEVPASDSGQAIDFVIEIPVYRHTNPSGSKHQDSSKIPVLDNNSLLNLFERVDVLSDTNNPECLVLKVNIRDCDTSPERALKINFSEPPSAVITKLNQLNHRHLLSVKVLGKINVNKKFIPQDSTNFVLPLKTGRAAKATYQVYVTVMELMEGNLKKLKKSPHEEAAYEIQRMAIEYFLYENGIVMGDIKETNVVWHTLPENDPMLKHTHLKYKIGTDDYYIPTPYIKKRLIKPGDIDEWEYRPNLPQVNYAEVFASRLKKAPKSHRDQIAALRERPPKGSRILDDFRFSKTLSQD